MEITNKIVSISYNGIDYNLGDRIEFQVADQRRTGLVDLTITKESDCWYDEVTSIRLEVVVSYLFESIEGDKSLSCSEPFLNVMEFYDGRKI